MLRPHRQDWTGNLQIITIIDAGIGNPSSISNMLNYLGVDVELVKSPLSGKRYSHLVLPGIGSFDSGIKKLNDSGWSQFIVENFESSKILGICLGMQLLTCGSEEGTESGLSLVPAYCKKFDSSRLRTPHIGWNRVEVLKKNHLVHESDNSQKFYFSHSYYVHSENAEISSLKSTYGEEFVAGFEIGNIMGVQFHPEKSHKFGMKLLNNFSQL
jgi:glutamine amidotransferase